MPPRIPTPQRRAPRDRELSAGGCFYAAEAVRLAGIRGLNYRQLRRLLRIVKGGEVDARRWARFSLREVLALKIAYQLATGRRTQHPYKRLRFAEVEHACEVLRTRYGIEEPLLEVRLEWKGTQLVAIHEAVCFQPLSGQLLLMAAEVRRNTKRLKSLDREDASLLGERLEAELTKLRAGRPAGPVKCPGAPMRLPISL